MVFSYAYAFYSLRLLLPFKETHGFLMILPYTRYAYSFLLRKQMASLYSLRLRLITFWNDSTLYLYNRI